MAGSRLLLAAFAVTLSFVWGCTSSGADGDLALEVAFSHDLNPDGNDPGPADVSTEDQGTIPADTVVAADPVSDPVHPDLSVADDPGTPDDPGPTDDGAPDLGPPDPGPSDTGTDHTVVIGTRKPGEYCGASSECADGAICVGSENTTPQCNPGCEVDADCAKVAINARGQCTAVDGVPMSVCLWLCGLLTGGICPGDGQCDGSACR